MLGTLCLLDIQPRVLNQREVKLLEAMADDVMTLLRQNTMQWGDAALLKETPDLPASAIVGQPLMAG